MASITIRDVDDDLQQRLKERAAVHGRSMEAEARGCVEVADVNPVNLRRPAVSVGERCPENLLGKLRVWTFECRQQFDAQATSPFGSKCASMIGMHRPGSDPDIHRP